MDRNRTKDILETLLFIADRPVPLGELSQILEEPENIVEAMIQDLTLEYKKRNSPIQLLEIAGGYQMATRPDHFPWVKKLYKDKTTMCLSNPSLETLSIIAYKQPITRTEIEEIRGVEVIAALETLLEKRLIKVVGRKETIGRPLLYGTTPEFLRHFGLKNLKELPSLESF